MANLGTCETKREGEICTAMKMLCDNHDELGKLLMALQERVQSILSSGGPEGKGGIAVAMCDFDCELARLIYEKACNIKKFCDIVNDLVERCEL